MAVHSSQPGVLSMSPLGITPAQGHIRLRLLEAGTMVVRVLLLPVALSLACSGLFIFGLVAKYADLRE